MAPSGLYARLCHAFLGLLYFSALLVWWDVFVGPYPYKMGPTSIFCRGRGRGAKIEAS